jgi:hypothetical protein
MTRSKSSKPDPQDSGGPVPRVGGNSGTEALIVQNVVFAERPQGRTRRELGRLFSNVDPDAVEDALKSLGAAGVVILDGKRVRPSECAVRLDELGVICI